MSPEESSASGGTAYTLSYHCSTPPLPQAPPPLFTPYKPDALGPSCDETTLDYSTSALEQNRDSWQEDELDLAAPPLPLSSPPTLTPTKDVPSCLMDGLEPRMGTDLLPQPVEAAGGGRPVSTLSEESLYATVRPPYVGQAATVQPYSDGAPVVDSTRSKQDKLGVSLGDLELRVGLGDLGFT